MYLKRLEAFGFKSFADRTRIEVDRGVTGIIGPNGCGKSNIVDALRWVLGEQSARDLRGHQMADVIFNGSQSRKPLSVAEVHLTFDNESGLLPVDFTEVTVTRRLFRDGASEYAINKAPCRLKDIRLLFLDTGVGTEAYSFMEQGRVEMIITAKPEERRFLFEEAAGVHKYRVRREEALRKLEKVEQNLTRLSDILRETGEHLTRLEGQARKARQYQKLQEDLKRVEVSLILQDWKSHQAEEEDSTRAAAAAESRLQALETDLREKEAAVEQARLALTEAEETLNRAREQSFQANAEIQRAEDRLTEARRRETEAQARQAALETERGNWQSDQDRVRHSRAETDAALARLTGEVEQARAEAAARDAAHRDAAAGLSRAREAHEAAQKTLYDRVTAQARTQNEQAVLRAQVQHLDDQIERTHTARGQAQQETAALERRLQELYARLAEAEARDQEAQATEERLTADLAKTSRDIRDQDAAVLESRTERERAASRVASYEELERMLEGYSEGVKMALAEKLPGVLGTVGQLLEPQADASAGFGVMALVEAAYKPALTYLICRTRADAERVVDYLAREKKGWAVCLVLEELPEAEPSGALQTALQVASPEIRKVVPFLFRGEVVTAESGARVSAPGLLQGGHPEGEVGLLMRRRALREGQERLRTLEFTLQSSLTDLDALRARLAGGQSELERVQASSQERAVSLAEWRRDREHLEIQAREGSESIRRLAEDLSGLEQARTGHLARLETLDQTQQETGPSREALEQAIRAAGAALREAETAEDAASKVSATALAGASVLVERLESVRRDALRLAEEDVKAAEALAANAESQRREAAAEQEARNLQASSSSMIAELDKSGSTAAAAVKRLEEVRAARLTAVDAWTHHERASRQAWSDAQAAARDVEVRRAQVLERRRALEDRLREGFGLSLEEAQTRLAAQTGDDEAETISPEAVERLRTRIESMGLVNLAALEDVARYQERQEFLTKQQDDLMKAKADLGEVISKVNLVTSEQFKTTFDQARRNFQEIYTRLFQGGEADLILTNESDILNSGVDIVARPPGKRQQSISLLSGGEKALTAIALLFGLFLVKASPFCVLDEVDAPLDDANLKRFTRILMEFSKKTQFLIITHNKGTMETADTLYGVTMEEAGVSTTYAVRFQREPAVDASVSA